jgi:hypothetical protein
MSSRGRLLLWLIVATAARPIAARANPVDDLLPGHWLEVPDSRLDALDPEDDPTLNPNWPIEAPWHGVEGQAGIMDDWSSAAYDTLRHRLAIWGGGHSGYAGNEVYVFDVESLRWERITNPSVDVTVTGTTLYPDGQPRARETYNYLHYLPQVDRMMSFGGGNLYPCCNETTETATFDFATRAWDTTRYAPRPDSGSPFSAIAAVDDATGHVWYLGGGLSRVAEFDPVANRWSLHAEDILLLNRTGAIDPIERKFVWFGGFGDTIAFDLDAAETAPAAQPTTGDREIELAIFPGFAYDSVRRVLVAWSEGDDVYTLDTRTWVWTRIPADPTNTVVPGPPNMNGTFGRFRYVPSKDVFILVNNVQQNVYFYRMPAMAMDSDADGLLDPADNCLHVPNGPGHPDGGGQVQLDSDGDGIGNACDADIAIPNDCRVTNADLAAFKQAFYSVPGRVNWNPSADSNGDGRVNFADMTLLRTDFQHGYVRENPSGIPNACTAPH